MLSKKILTLAFACLLIVAASSSSFAQSRPGDKAGRTSDMLYKKLNLSNDQYTKVYQTFLNYYSKEGSSMTTGKNHKESGYASKEDWDAVKNSLSSVLNKDQYAEFSSMNEHAVMNPVMKKRHKKSVTSTEKKEVTSTTSDKTGKEMKKSEEPKKTTTTTTDKNNTTKKVEPKKEEHKQDEHKKEEHKK